MRFLGPAGQRRQRGRRRRPLRRSGRRRDRRRGSGAGLRRGRSGCRFGSVRFEGQRLPQRRDRTGDALPQDALVVAQPPPAHVCGSCLGPGRGSNFDFGLESDLDSRLLVFTGFLSSAVFSVFSRLSSPRVFLSAFLSSWRVSWPPAWTALSSRRPSPAACFRPASGLHRLGRRRFGFRRLGRRGFVRHQIGRTRPRQRNLVVRRREKRLRHQHDEFAVMAQPPGHARGLVAGAEIEVGARRADDRAAGVLRDHQPFEPGVGLQPSIGR